MPRAFFNAWTMIEAAVKATGRGLAHGARDVDISIQETGRCALHGIAGTGGRYWTGRECALPDPFVASVVWEGGAMPVNVKHW
jgi:4'-phosphopantetheinyl transferase